MRKYLFFILTLLLGSCSGVVSVNSIDNEDFSPNFEIRETISEPAEETGKISLQRWTMTEWPTAANTLKFEPRFPHNPDTEILLNNFEYVEDQGKMFGQRISGYIYPPVTGTYTFFVAGDNFAELWLSRSSDPYDKVMIANIPEFTYLREWNKYPTQRSNEIELEEGQPYYIEAIATNGAQDDHLSVGWQIPDSELISVIEGRYLEPVSRD